MRRSISGFVASSVQEFVEDVHEQCLRRDVKEMIENLRDQRRQQRHQQQGKQLLERQQVALAPAQAYVPATQEDTGAAEASMPSACITSTDREAGEDDCSMDID